MKYLYSIRLGVSPALNNDAAETYFFHSLAISAKIGFLIKRESSAKGALTA